MGRTRLGHILIGCVVVTVLPWLHGCTGQAPRSAGGMVQTAAKTDERTCLVRAMYFESNRSSRDGLMAVGTVVMNRVASPRFPNSICGVVGQRGQFASGALTNPLNPRELPPVERAADAILAGERYKPIGDAMWFHVASLRIPYRVQYTAVAGGNAFYRRTGRRYADLRGEPGTLTGVMAQNTSSTEASLAATPAPNVVERLFGYAAKNAPRYEPGCDPAKSGLGAISLACEEASVR